jgi:hypothetical protein
VCRTILLVFLSTGTPLDSSDHGGVEQKGFFYARPNDLITGRMPAGEEFMQDTDNRMDWKLPFLGIVTVVIIILVVILFGGDPGFFSKNSNSGSVPAATGGEKTGTSVLINASPQRYSPMMSSTPGIGLLPDTYGFGVADARYEWNASYGQFLGWSVPGYQVSEKGASVANDGEKIYWSFYTMPPLPQDPVIISLTAKDKKTGAVLGSSRMTLGWQQNNTFVEVRMIE